MGSLDLYQYSDWSDWSVCSLECGGGFRFVTRICPMSGNACGGPDIAKKWDICNDLPCANGEKWRVFC